MIIVGYQGIGKSSLAGTNGCIDLESSNFWVDGKRDENWYKPYCQIAVHLSEQGYTVFVSSHEVVRKELAELYPRKTWIVYPALELRSAWITKLLDRYKQTGLEKDYKALMNAADRYDSNIVELSTDKLQSYEIIYIDYQLSDIIKTIKTNDSIKF